MTRMAIFAALITASLGSFSCFWNKPTWFSSVLRPSGASASVVRALIAFRRTLLVSLLTSFSKGGMASAPRAAYFPEQNRNGFRIYYRIQSDKQLMSQYPLINSQNCGRWIDLKLTFGSWFLTLLSLKAQSWGFWFRLISTEDHRNHPLAREWQSYFSPPSAFHVCLFFHFKINHLDLKKTPNDRLLCSSGRVP